MPEARLILRVLDMAIRDTRENRSYITKSARIHGKTGELQHIDSAAQYINKGYWADLEAIGLDSSYVLRVLKKTGVYPAQGITEKEMQTII
jgi:hypothetical protein